VNSRRAIQRILLRVSVCGVLGSMWIFGLSS
jgi:hypothetical protein